MIATMDDRETTQGEPHERQFGEAHHASPPVRRVSNSRRLTPYGSRPNSLMKWLLLAIMLVLVLTYTYLKDVPPPWEEGLRRDPFTEKTPDLSAPARMKVLLGAAAKIDASKLPAQHPWLWETPLLARTL